jgi:tetratricopeptide (TPR) repeat protein
MGEVYCARDEKLHRDVAIKLLPASFISDPDRLARFEREARLLAALNHPSIGAIYGYEEAGDIHALALELVEGPTLAERIAVDRPTMKEALTIGCQIAEALEAAHERGIIHRDLKPANIKVSPDGRVKVLDFGLAKTFDDKAVMTDLAQTATMPAGATQVGAILGTGPYMSPEQMRGRPVDKRTDIWAFGCVLFEMVSGRTPFAGETMSDLVAAILEREPDWEALPPTTPPRVRQLLGRCLEKDHRHRLRDIGDARLELRETLAADASTELHVRSRQRHVSRRVVVAAAIASMVAAAGVWAAVRRYRGPSSPAIERRLSDGNRVSPNADANAYYERALLFGGAGVANPEQAQKMVERALELDRKFAAARAELGFFHVARILNGRSNDASLFYKAEGEVRQALNDDPRCGRAHSVLALIYLLQGRKELVPGEVEQALKENSTDPTAHSWLLAYHRFNGDYGRAREQADWLIRQWPLFWPAHLDLGELLRDQGDSANAIREQERVLEQDSENVDALGVLARAYIDAGDLAKARQTLDRALRGNRQNLGLRQHLALLLALEGNTTQASREMDVELQTYAGMQIYGPAEAADFYAVMGDTKTALEWLRRAVRLGDERDEYLRRNPLLANLRADPGFQQILDAVAYRRQQRTPR